MTRCCRPSHWPGFGPLSRRWGAGIVSSYKKGILYTGLCFSYYHKQFLSAHLERSIWHAMSDDTDLLYEPRLVSCLVDDGGGQPSPAGRSSFKGQKQQQK